ncbi:MAG: histidine kinase [Candidatus Dactylopiibacterium carminicum]|uniref:HDOD domain-containing protein n=1 Tax=Candidatus Dactylopiibacterium carminicum TaxID=857335 RepID=A0A272ETJ2_9RHOO|nr:HDOD domain-containing protein [Candidatus Dactylopiibacterium carminicum]KAF7599417.1 HDOD domain-containing protein [Candidatus Dactylopiibacterium carminicum]PAS93425.1 MAG: histidine kinase [Candidatus Dactylopiibacterium carminicum]PAS95944.1 MAG: histidine kinase [Candidatus Dactylopiibacterium carminicum]PAS99426.1 MAG: histidine kinase [Candidatus Dactylopiibacterium carminicum]
MLEQPLESIDSYIEYFASREIPVLRRSMRSLAALQRNQDQLSGRVLATEVLQDPMLALRLLVLLESTRSERQNHDITTIDRAIMMMGLSRFFGYFGQLPTVEDALSEHPKDLIGLLRVVSRARNAARWARDFALQRHDIDVDKVTVAALLHEAAEILFWCFAPDFMQKIEQIKQANPGTRSAVAQTAVLGVNIRDVQLALVQNWHLPQLLVTLMNEQHADNPRVRTVILACDLARHAANGWDDPALPDDYTGIAGLLHMRRSAVMQRVGVPEEYWRRVAASEDAG